MQPATSPDRNIPADATEGLPMISADFTAQDQEKQDRNASDGTG